MDTFDSILKDLNFSVKPDLFAWEKYNRIIDDSRTIKGDKQLVQSEPFEFNLDTCGNELPNNRFFTNIGSAHFEGFFNKGSDNTLIVFFNGARTGGNRYALVSIPRFTSWSWHVKCQSSILSFEDPMYYLYDECTLGWFYGTKDENFREYAAKIIKKVADNLQIPYSNIILYGRSGGGTAAVGVSDFIKGCSTVSVNMQIDFEHYYYTEFFEKITGVNNLQNDPRLNIADIIKRNSQNDYLVITNAASNIDLSNDLKLLSEKCGFTPCYGLTVNENILSWVYEAYGAPEAHKAFENYYIFSLIITALRAYKAGVDLNTVNSFVDIVNEYWFEKYIGQSKAYKLNEELEKAKKENERQKEEILEIKRQNDILKKQLNKRQSNIIYRVLRKIKRVVKKIIK